MAELDFSGLNRIMYQGAEPVAEQKRMDFTTLPERAETPVTAPQTEDASKTTTAPETRSERKREAFTDVSGKRNYSAMYRAAHDYHKRHSPPRLDMEYWRDHDSGTPQTDREYWDNAAEDICNTALAFDNDPFLMGVLSEIYDELEREYKTLRGAQMAAPSS